jgi:glycerol-3-phosphate dehydrogenase (NAD(P)+)
MKISVLESGSWGTALAAVLARNGHEVTLHSLHTPRSALLRQTHENTKLPGVRLPEELRFTDGFGGVETAEAVFVVTPSVAVRETAHALRGVVRDEAIIVSAAKGIEKGSSLRMSEVIAQEAGGAERIVALSGPSHAEEVGRGIPTGLVSASENAEAASAVQDMLMSGVLRVYTSADSLGVELCGALKNIIAICAGISFGLGFGDNTSAMLMTRGLSEMTALGEALGGSRDTFAGLAGVGDLIVTCTSPHSRNRTAGLYIGQGMSVEAALKKVGAVVEGYYATQSALELSARAKVEMPIAEALGGVLFNGKSPREATLELMTRAKRGELA